MTNYPWRVKAGTLLSQSINALILGGHPDMSLSTRAYLESDHSSFWRFVFRAANRLFGTTHCFDSWQSDLEYARDIYRSTGAKNEH
jgi:hypothetical protein